MSGRIGNKKDLDALAFIAAAGIVDRMQQLAITYLVYNLKSNNLWDKMQAIYPMVGGTATTHKFNLKDPRDLDIAFRITFGGSATHNSNGLNGNTTNNTHYNFATYGVFGSTHMSLYSRTDAQIYLRAVETTNTKGAQMFTTVTVSGLVFLADMYNDSGGANTRISIPNSYNVGFFSSSKISAPKTFLHYNGLEKISNTVAPTGILPNTDTLLILSSGANCAFSSIGLGLTESESTILYNIVQQYQTTLGRQI